MVVFYFCGVKSNNLAAYLTQLPPVCTRVVKSCNTFYTREKQSNTFIEQRRSTQFSLQHEVHSRFRGRVIDGVPFRSSPLREVMLFLLEFLYFFLFFFSFKKGGGVA